MKLTENDAKWNLWTRYAFLRALGLIFFSAFFSMHHQILGLIGSHGILPVSEYLSLATRSIPGMARFYFVPTLFWANSGDASLVAVCWIGMAASVLLMLNFFPRLMILICELLFLSFISTAQDFSSYQSDGMLLEAGFISFFLAPKGMRPGMGEKDPPSRLMIFLLLWEWFRIYFESGLVKILSGDPQWRSLTAMDHYYENAPLPTWLSWYAQELPSEMVHKAIAGATLGIELFLVWLAWFPRKIRLILFGLTSLLQVGIIATGNYAFLNYLVFSLGLFLLWSPRSPSRPTSRLRKTVMAVVFLTVGIPTLFSIPGIAVPEAWRKPELVLSPFRIANSYGLFAVMTEARYEIEFQGSNDGTHWTAYPFIYKPQDVHVAPRIFAPYQPRFEWNLWFASLGKWEDYPWVVSVETRLLENSKQVLSLFKSNPFPGTAPRFVRSVIYQYRFADPKTKSDTGQWWTRTLLGSYAPAMSQ